MSPEPAPVVALHAARRHRRPSAERRVSYELARLRVADRHAAHPSLAHLVGPVRSEP